ncbi:hypothetical protein ACFC09_01955 [Streptomyces sp. NPDC056161]|uniref:hypothetical protein n=1 Tax=Streptomyces sp. NPDC056161 TaxID=3345732 RepID=UPI0035D9D555
MAGWIPVAQADRTIALSWNSGTSVLILALAELLLLVWLLLRRLARRQGGWRRTWRRLRRQVRLTRRAFSEPVREFLRFRAAIRRLTRLLAAQGTGAVAHHALDGVDGAVRPTAAEAFGFAVTVRPATRRNAGEVAVRVAGRDVPPPPQPWRTDGDPLVWYASAVDAANLAPRQAAASDADGTARPPAVPRVLVPLGLSADGVVLLDLLRGSRILSTYGEHRAVRAFVQAVAAYLDLPGGSAQVLVTRGVQPGFDGPDLDSLLDSLAVPEPGRTRPVVVVCAAPDDEQAARLSELAGAGLLCAVVVGPMSAHRWEIRVDSRGRTETPGLGIETDAGPLGPAVARAARRSGARRSGARKRRGGQPTAVPAAVPAGGPAGGPTGPWPPAGPDPRHPGPRPAVPAPRPSLTAVPTVPAPAARPTPQAGTAVPGARRTDRAGTAAPHPSLPADAPPVPAPEPLAPAVRDLFAEPETTGVPAAGTPDAESFDIPRAERRNES